MKIKIAFLTVLFAVLALPAFSQDQQIRVQPQPWEFLQLGLWNGVANNQNVAYVNGLRIGLPVSGGTAEVNGAELGLLGASTDDVNGLQAGVFAAVANRINGVQFSIASICDTVFGVQIGVVNIAKTRSVQLGLCNYIADSAVPFLPIINVKF